MATFAGSVAYISTPPPFSDGEGLARGGRPKLEKEPVFLLKKYCLSTVGTQSDHIVLSWACKWAMSDKVSSKPLGRYGKQDDLQSLLQEHEQSSTSILSTLPLSFLGVASSQTCGWKVCPVKRNFTTKVARFYMFTAGTTLRSLFIFFKLDRLEFVPMNSRLM